MYRLSETSSMVGTVAVCNIFREKHHIDEKEMDGNFQGA